MSLTNHRNFIRARAVYTTMTILILVLLLASQANGQKKEKQRLQACAKVLNEILSIPEDVPKDIIDGAECVLVLPSVRKSSLLLGSSYGRGALSCRTGENFDGPWSPPAMYRLVGLSVGFQFGGQSTDFVVMVMNKKGAAAILKSKVKLGSDASVAAGPKGRTVEASTQGTLDAEMLSYSRSKGVFVGVSLSGSNLQCDEGDNEHIYNQKLNATQIVREGAVQATPEGQQLIDILKKHSPKNRSK
ncbi:MAG TPA: lipid-binding SYLF domain-containing protein [Blastocatellia bacterium]|nr:lipid-binding SYLF domain-containing protein [Blastocatellia bacterium]